MCVKDGNKTENEGINRTAREYQVRMEKQADSTIQACTKGQISEKQAKVELAKQFVADPRGLERALEKLERELKSGKAVQSVRTHMHKEGRTLEIVYQDGHRDMYSIHRNGEVWYTAASGILYDSTIRDMQSHHGQTRISGLVGSQHEQFVGHTTMYFPDKYRASWDNPNQTGFHWTNVEKPRSDQEARHAPPSDAHRGNDPR